MEAIQEKKQKKELAGFLVARQSLLQTSEVIQVLSEIHKRIIESSVNEHFCDIPIREQEGKLRAAILFVITMLGIKNEPDKITVSLILNFMRTHFRHFTMQEFRLAFEMNILSEDEKKPQHFHNFNLEFVTPVLRNYLECKREALEAMQRVPVKKQLTEHIPTDKEYYDSLIAFIEKNKQLPAAWNWIAAFNHMEDSGMITETDAEIKEFKIKVKQEATTQAQLKKLKAVDIIERNKIDEIFAPKNMSALYKTEYVKMKLKP